MNKFTAFLLAIIFTLSIFFLTSSQDSSYREEIVVSRIIDGDTIKTSDGKTLRLANINSPEKNTHNYEASVLFLKSFENQSLEIEILGYDKYQRLLVRAYYPEYLNLELVKRGLASKFLVEESEVKKFSEAEKSAISSSIGIWEKSNYFGCFKSDINKNEETVTLTNICSPINLNLWTIKDESRKSYKFENISLGDIILHSSQGKNTESDLFWQSTTDIWNNDRDSLYLFDEKGRIAHYETYGY